MRETKPVQLEIFSSSAARPDTGKRPNAILEYLWGYEKIILILIGFLVVSIVSFSLGVEKGKRVARNNLIQNNPNGTSLDQASVNKTAHPATRTMQPTPQPAQRKITAPTRVVTAVPAGTTVTTRVVTAVPAGTTVKNATIAQNIAQPLQTPAQTKLSGQIGNFTIQIASYETKKFAEAEAEKLKKKGFTTLILPKGNYIILCVGRFPTQNEAKLALKELQKKYEGCYIRRL